MKFYKIKEVFKSSEKWLEINKIKDLLEWKDLERKVSQNFEYER